MRDQPPLGKTFLSLPAIKAYGIWVIIFLFPIVLSATLHLIDEKRSLSALFLSAIALGIIAVSYIFRFYRVRNSELLRSKLLSAETREKALAIISGGFWWWLITLICAVAAVLFSRKLI